MRVEIRTESRPINIPFPTHLVFNTLAVYLYCRAQHSPIALSAANKFCRGLHRYKRNYPHMPLLHVQTEDTSVCIRL